MEIAKPIFYIVAATTLFGIFGGFDPTNSVAEMGIRALMVGLVFGTIAVLKEVKDQVLTRI